jgi:hypothetical protein
MIAAAAMAARICDPASFGQEPLSRDAKGYNSSKKDLFELSAVWAFPRLARSGATRKRARTRWLDIGSVWTHRDGKGFDVTLDALPTDGRIVIRLDEPKPDSAA